MFFKAHGTLENREPVDAGLRGLGMWQPVGRNRVINGDFAINQRNLAACPGFGQFCHDRWKAWYSTATYSAETPAAGELPESAVSYARLVTSHSNTATDFAKLQQHIESVRTLSGKVATVSFWARAASGEPSLAVTLSQAFGSGGSGGVNVPFGKLAVNNVWTRYSLTGQIPSISGKTVGTTDCLVLQIWTSAGSNYAGEASALGIQSTDVGIWGVQIEEGPYASAYEQKPSARELRDCQRYFRRLSGAVGLPIAVGMNSGTQNAGFLLPLPVPMRAVPTIAISSAGDFSVLEHGNNWWACSGMSLGNATSEIAWIDVTIATASLTQYRTSLLRCTNANAGIDFTAEL